MDIVLDDGMASGEAVLAISQELADMVGGDVDEIFEDTSLPEGATVEPYEDDGYVGQRYVFEDTELTEFSDEDLSITYDQAAGRYEVTGVMDFGTEEDLADLPPDLADTFDVSLSVTFPGEVVEHNGELEGQTVTWTPAMGEVTDIHAVAAEESGTPSWPWIALAALLVLLVVALAVVVGRRRKQEVPSEGAAEDAAQSAAGRDSATDDVPRDLSPAAQGATDDVTRDLSEDAPAEEAAPDDDAAGRSSDDDRR